MEEIIIKLINKEKITEQDLEYALYEMCDREHSSCSDACIVNRLNGGTAPDTAKDFEKNRGCDCFKNGKAMLQFIKTHKNNE